MGGEHAGNGDGRGVAVALVFGSAASGSTKLARMLGETPGSFLAGDLRKVWSRGLRDDRPCGCGRPFLRCPFWQRVGDEAFGGWARLDAERIVALAKRVHSAARIGRLLSFGGKDPDAARYGGYVRRLLEGVASASGARTVVCHAKEPYQGLVLARSIGAPLRWVHVVRDPRDIAWLWTIGTVQMERHHPLVLSTARILGRWDRRNALAPLLSGMGHIAYRRVRFEDLVRSPEPTLERVLRFVGASSNDRRGATAAEEHAVMMLDRDDGPCRLIEVDVRLGESPAMTVDGGDVERWRRELSPATRAAVTAATLPMTATFGYLGKH